MIFTSPETRMIVLRDSEDRMINHIFIRIDKIPERDGRTDGQTEMPWLLQL